MPLDYNRSVTEELDKALLQYADNSAFSCMGRTLSYRDLDRLSRGFSAYLQQLPGVEPGDRVVVQLPNILQYPVVALGVLRAGLVIVNTNPLYTPRELKHQLTDSGAKVLVVLANVAQAAAEVVEESSVETVIVTELADLHSPFKRLLINSVVKYIKKMVPKVHFSSSLSFREALRVGFKEGSQKSYSSVVRSPESLAVLQYTGGTTGVAKGAMLSHRNLMANMEQGHKHLAGGLQLGGEIYVAPLPLYHIYAFMIHFLCMLSSGSHNILIPNPRDIPAFVEALKGQKFTGFVGLNTLFIALCHNEDFRLLDFSHLRTTTSGGMALTADAARLWFEVTGSRVAEGYGLTETSPIVAVNPLNAIQPGTVGVPMAETELKVVDEQGQTLAIGEEGELCIRGPQVMQGYWQRPQETADVLDSDGWLKSGDMAVIQPDGYIRIVDRKKDMILVSGFNVYPNEIEDVVCEHPGVLEAAAIGVEDESSGELVKLFIVRADPALSEADVQAHCKKNLTGYKRPKFIEFRDELPKTNVGKVLRRELRDT